MTQKYEIGSQWETRGGWRAVVNKVGSLLTVWHDIHGTCGMIMFHTSDGASTMVGEGVNRDDSGDLLRPWVEKRSGWVIILENEYGQQSGGQFHLTKDDADNADVPKGYKRIACVKWTEGDGV